MLSLDSLMWPFKRDKARKLLEDIRKHKVIISLCLTSELLLVYSFLLNTLHKVRSNINSQDLKYIWTSIKHIRRRTNSK
jgi:hypothetical protein